MRVLRILQRISHRAIDRLRHVHTYPQCVRLLNAPPLIGLRIQISKGIDCIESVQRHAACFVNSDYSRYSSISSMAVQGRVTTLRSGYHPLQSTFTNALSMRDQSLRGTHYQLMLLVRHLTQNLSEQCPLLYHINLITSFIFIPCNSIPCKCFIVISYHVFQRPLAAPLPDQHKRHWQLP